MKRFSMFIMIGLLVLLGQGCILSSTPVSPVSIEAGDSVTLQVSVFPSNISLQWYVDDNPVSGSTDKSFIYAPDEVDVGTHTVVVKETSGCIFLGQHSWEVEVISDPSLVAYYPFNGNADDESGNGNNGTVYGAILTEDRFGNPNSAFAFNNNPDPWYLEAQDYISIPDSPTLRPSNDMTVAVWSKTSYSAGRVMIAKRYGPTYLKSYCLWYNVGTLWFTYGASSDSGIINYSPIPTLGEWHHLAGVWDGSHVRLYIDGIEVNNQDYTVLNQYDNHPLLIGANGDENNIPDGGWNGQIDEVRIYNRALSATEIAALYNLAK
jgi:hypothetical protein